MSAPEQLFPDCFFNMVWRPFRNATSPAETIPAFAVMSLQSGTAFIDNEILVEATKPIAAASLSLGPTSPFFVNSQFSVPTSGGVERQQGFCSALLNNAGYAAYDDTTGTPDLGQVWGPTSGSWLLSRNKPGFVVIGAARTVDGIKVAPVVQQSVPTQCYVEYIMSGVKSIGDYVDMLPTSDVGSGISLVSGPYLTTGILGKAVGLSGRYEYRFHAKITNSAFSAGVAVAIVRAYKYTLAGVATGISPLNWRADSIPSVPAVTMLTGFVNLDYGDTVAIKVEDIQPAGTATFTQGQMTLRNIGPQLTANNAPPAT